MRYYKRSLRARLGISFRTHTVEGVASVIREAKDTIADEKMSHDPICLITSAVGELPVDFTVLQNCLRVSLTQPSKIKHEHKLFLINEDELKGKDQFSFSITYIFFFTLAVLSFLYMYSSPLFLLIFPSIQRTRQAGESLSTYMFSSNLIPRGYNNNNDNNNNNNTKLYS